MISVDNYFTGSRRNIAHLLQDPHFEAVRPASPIHYQRAPMQTTKTSVHGAINMLGRAKRLKARIFQASTSEIYGNPLIHPQTEDSWGNVNPIGIRSCYDEGKRCAETLFFDYWRPCDGEIGAGLAAGCCDRRRAEGNHRVFQADIGAVVDLTSLRGPDRL